MYNPLAQFYEEVFPVSESQIHFVESAVIKSRPSGDSPRPRLLEVGCAVGDLAAAVAATGVEVDAIDLNPAMIRKARSRHGRHAEAGLLRFHEMDMLDIDTNFEADSFDAVACLGNTLVHLPGPSEIECFLQAAARILRTGTISGTIILQILNYAHLLERRPVTLPPIETEKLRFEREYSYPANGGELITFSTRLHIKGNNEVYDNTVELYPLQQVELELLLQRAGFTQTSFYGGFDASPLQPDSLPLIAVARL